MTTDYPCPICGDPITAKLFHDQLRGEQILAESYASCPSGHWSQTYAWGLSTEVVGYKTWAWLNDESRAEFESREKAVAEAIAAHPDYCIGVGA